MQVVQDLLPLLLWDNPLVKDASSILILEPVRKHSTRNHQLVPQLH